MTWQDSEQIVQQHKEMAHNAAEAYPVNHAEDATSRRPTVWVRGLASVGGILITVGYRLQSGYAQMAATTLEPVDGLRLSRNGTGHSGH